jgi:hypothetical protein
MCSRYDDNTLMLHSLYQEELDNRLEAWTK